ncbi:hypothetical protein DYD21_14035 [Rhodohalobacter sp. SW132]|nr:hypothetical protein DYD21_14035 [Rhodohalobacter sp. SW132]
MNGIHLFRNVTSPVSGRHIRSPSPRGSQGESLGYKEADFYRSTVVSGIIRTLNSISVIKSKGTENDIRRRVGLEGRTRSVSGN